MRPQKTKRSLLDKIGIGGLSLLIALAGVAIHLEAVRNFRLVLRDEPQIAGAPTVFVVAGMLFSLLILLWFWLLTLLQNRRIGWGIGAGQTRGTLGWEQVIVGAVIGGLFGTIGSAFFLNGFFDHSPEQTQRCVVKQLIVKESDKGVRSHYLIVTDWKAPHKTVQLFVGGKNFDCYRVGKHLNIKTKRGWLGYEWITKLD